MCAPRYIWLYNYIKQLQEADKKPKNAEAPQLTQPNQLIYNEGQVLTQENRRPSQKILQELRTKFSLSSKTL